MSKNRVLITGANGFIGSKLMNFFEEQGYAVTGWDIGNSFINDKVKNVDMSNSDCVTDELSQLNPDILIHCAGCADVGKSVMYPDVDFEGNVRLTHNLLFSLHKLNMSSTRFVFLSSAGIYGNPTTLPITETMERNPLSPYAVHKVMCEDLCIYFAKNYGMNIKIARIFSAYGAGLRKQIFWDMYNKIRNTGELPMFGTGDESRDYIHALDVVNSLYLLATKDSEHIIFNVANGQETTIRTVAEYFADTVGLSRDMIKFNGVIREGDPLNWKADISRIRELGYVQKVSIQDGIKDYYQWCENITKND